MLVIEEGATVRSESYSKRCTWCLIEHLSVFDCRPLPPKRCDKSEQFWFLINSQSLKQQQLGCVHAVEEGGATMRECGGKAVNFACHLCITAGVCVCVCVRYGAFFGERARNSLRLPAAKHHLALYIAAVQCITAGGRPEDDRTRGKSAAGIVLGGAHLNM